MENKKVLIKLAAPLMLSNLLQQLYTTADAIIVGNIIGSKALAAVGSSGYISLILIYFFMGISVGASIVMAKHFGAKDEILFSKAVHTTAALSLISGVFLTIVGVLFAPYFLTWINVPENVFEFALVYLRIYFFGMLPMLIYNMGSGVLRSVGNTKSALYYLAVAVFVNVVLDYIFIVHLNSGIVGAAYASTIAQTISAGLIVIKLIYTKEIYRLVPRRICLDRKELKDIVRIGAPTGTQSVLQSFSNIYIQSKFNLFGASVMAGVTAYGKIEGFLYMPIEVLALALSTMVGQLVGSKHPEKIKIIMKDCMQLCVGITIFVSLIFCLNAELILRLFTSESVVLNHGTDMLYVVTPLYFIYGINQIFGSAIRSSGNPQIPMFIILICMCGFRIAWNMVIPEIWETPHAVYSCYPFSWILTFIVFYIYYKKSNWLKREKKREEQILCSH